jgi:hypothetical protein
VQETQTSRLIIKAKAPGILGQENMRNALLFITILNWRL